MAIIPALFLSLSFYFETAAYSMRVIGNKMSMSSLGYSLHVQIATISRVFNLIALPILGWMIDVGVAADVLIFVPIYNGIIFVILSICHMRLFKNRNIDVRLFIFLAKKISKISLEYKPFNFSKNKVILDFGAYKTILYFGISSSFLIISGSFIPIILASVFFEYRATYLQLAPIFTAIGTLVSVVYFDPRVSMWMDLRPDDENILEIIFKARTLAMILLVFVSSSIYIYRHI